MQIRLGLKITQLSKKHQTTPLAHTGQTSIFLGGFFVGGAVGARHTLNCLLHLLSLDFDLYWIKFFRWRDYLTPLNKTHHNETELLSADALSDGCIDTSLPHNCIHLLSKWL